MQNKAIQIKYDKPFKTNLKIPNYAILSLYY